MTKDKQLRIRYKKSLVQPRHTRGASKSHASAIIRYFNDGFLVEEIAHILGFPPGTVKSVIETRSVFSC